MVVWYDDDSTKSSENCLLQTLTRFLSYSYTHADTPQSAGSVQTSAVSSHYTFEIEISMANTFLAGVFVPSFCICVRDDVLLRKRGFVFKLCTNSKVHTNVRHIGVWGNWKHINYCFQIEMYGFRSGEYIWAYLGEVLKRQMTTRHFSALYLGL